MTARGSWISMMALGLLAPTAALAEAPDVVASVKPIHSLVASVMAGVGEPALLVKGIASPHDYALTPSDAAALENADLVFRVGEEFELFLVKPLHAISNEDGIIDLAATPGLILLASREGGLRDPHHDEPESEAHVDDEHPEHGAFDGHLWLDPRNAKLMADRIADVLANRDPENAVTYRANADALRAMLEGLDAELATRLMPVSDVPFIVFHDAYQYFEKRYGLAGVGSITVSPEQPPGAKRLQEIQEKIAADGARCVFREPNFEPALVEAVVAGTPARSGVLDPEGASLNEGAELYFDLLRGIADSLKSCLADSS